MLQFYTVRKRQRQAFASYGGEKKTNKNLT